MFEVHAIKLALRRGTTSGPTRAASRRCCSGCHLLSEEPGERISDGRIMLKPILHLLELVWRHAVLLNEGEPGPPTRHACLMSTHGGDILGFQEQALIDAPRRQLVVINVFLNVKPLCASGLLLRLKQRRRTVRDRPLR